MNLFLKTNAPPKSPINAAPIFRSVLVLSPVIGSKLDIPSCPAGVLESPDEPSRIEMVIGVLVMISPFESVMTIVELGSASPITL